MTHITPSLVIESLSSQNGGIDAHTLLLHMIDQIFRDDSTFDILGGAGFVCMVGFRRRPFYHESVSTVAPSSFWFRNNRYGGQLRDLYHAEEVLQQNYKGRIWKVYLRGQQHDYYFYAKFDTIRDCLNLIEVSRVMHA